MDDNQECIDVESWFELAKLALSTAAIVVDCGPMRVSRGALLGTVRPPSRFLPQTSERPTSARGSSLWPTPTAASYGSRNNGNPGDGRDRYETAGAPSLETIARSTGGALSPTWVESLMGFPLGWTAGLRGAASRKLHGSHLALFATDATGPDAIDCEH